MRRPAAPFRRLAVATAVLIYCLIVVGGIVRVTGSGDGCGSTGGWPLCNGSLLPALRTTTLIEFSHRWITTIATLLVVALALSAWLTQRRFRRVVVGATIATVLLIVQIALGALVVEFDLPGGLVMIHLANALLLLGVLVYVAVTANTIAPADAREAGPGTAAAPPPSPAPEATGVADRLSRRRPAAPPTSRGATARLTAVAAIATYILALSGALVVETGSSAGCNGWPLCGGGFQLPASTTDIIDMVHRVVAGLVVVVIGLVMGVVIRRYRGDRSMVRAAMVVNFALLLQIAGGALVVVLRLPAAVQALHIALASLLWATVVLVAVLTRSRESATVTEVVSQPQRADALQRTPRMVST